MASCIHCGRSDKVMRCICDDCCEKLELRGIHKGTELPPLFTRCEPDADDGHLVSYQISDPVLVWCQGRECPWVVAVYERDEGAMYEGWESADHTGEILRPDCWMELPGETELAQLRAKAEK